MKNILLIVAIQTVAMLSNATTYYVSGTGADANAGNTVKQAWRTIDKINSFVFLPGDDIQFEAGITFKGAIVKENVTGLTFSSYGFGKAIIASGKDNGIYLGNCSGINVSNLVLLGSGYDVMNMGKHGLNIFLYPNVTRPYTNIKIDNVEVIGYGGNGALFYTASTNYGFGNVRVTNSSFHNNGLGGFSTLAAWDNAKKAASIPHFNIYVANCKAFYNYGVAGYKDSSSGSGFLIGSVAGGLIEYCEAYENGSKNGSSNNGAVGIRMADCSSVAFRHCISHHNRGGVYNKDGGGFKIDGGCINSVVENCDSYENEGAGYGFLQYSTGNKWSQDTVRNCTSTNDGRNIAYGAFSFSTAGATYKVTDAQIYGNRVSLNKEGKVLSFAGGNFTNIQIHSNAFCITSPGVFYSTIYPNVTLSNNIFPCLILSIKAGSFKVKRIS